MKDKNSRRRESEKKKKRFYLALYSCVGVLAVIAVVLAISNVQKFNNNKITQEHGEVATVEEDSATVNRPLDEGIPKEQSEANYDDSTAFFRRKKDKDKTDDSSEEIDEADDETEKDDAEDEEKTKEEIKEDEKVDDSAEVEEVVDEDMEEEIDDTAAQEQIGNETHVVDENIEGAYNYFSEFDADKEKMEWPLVGEIVMPFSPDKLVYDKTLEQYRTNSNICIAAPIGTQIKSTSSGVVVQVDSTREYGNRVMIDHGNGWTTTYSQLQDNVLVKLGDVVEKGQVIGGVDSPSIYSVLLGNHLNFVVKKDSVAVNPETVLMER